MQSTRAQPNPDAVVDQYLDPIRSPVGEEISMMRTRFAEDANDVRQCRLRSGAHVQRLRGQPHRVNPNQRSNSRSQAAQSAAAAKGQPTLTTVAPRRSSIVICCEVLTELAT